MRQPMIMEGRLSKPWLRQPSTARFISLASFLFKWTWLLSTFQPASCQTIGVDICACSPSVYTFQLNFSFTCDEQTVSDNPGVKGEDCFVQGLRQQDGVTDFVPVKVSTFEILELDANQGIIQSGYYQQGYFDGATISYTSITGKPDVVQNLTVDQLPRGLQINIIAQNANEEDIINTWIVLFTNMCNAFPVFEVGDQDGWTLILGLENPLGYFCPPASPAPSTSAAPSASAAPTISSYPSVSSYPSPTGPPVPPVESETPSSFPSCIPSYSPLAYPSQNLPINPSFSPTLGRGKGKGKGMGGMMPKVPKNKLKGKGKGAKAWRGLRVWDWDDYMSFPYDSSKSKGGHNKSKYTDKTKSSSNSKRPPQHLCQERSYKKKSYKTSKQSSKVTAPIGKVKAPKYKKKLPIKSKAQSKIRQSSSKAKATAKAKAKSKASKNKGLPKSKGAPSKSKGASSSTSASKQSAKIFSSKGSGLGPIPQPAMPSSKVSVPTHAPGPQSWTPNHSELPSAPSSPLAPAVAIESQLPSGLTLSRPPSPRPSPISSSEETGSPSQYAP